MAITYTAPAGSTITTFAKSETLGSQTQQSGNNTVVMADALSVGNNGQIGTKFATYVGRLLLKNIAGTQEVRMCTAITNGTGTTKILTVHEDWTTNPVDGDTIHVFYDVDDIETGGVSGGIQLSVRTGLYEYTNKLVIGDGTNPAGLQQNAGIACETNDGGSTLNVTVKSNGYYYFGYMQGSTPISGGINTFINNTANEPSCQWQSGSKGWFCDSLLWAQLVSLFYECASGSGVVFNSTKFLNLTYASTFFGATLTNCSISGKSSSSELIRLNSTTTVNGLVIINTAGLTTAASDTTTETITVKNAIFAGNVYLILINSNKTWKIINPTWSATTYSDFNWLTSTANYVYDQRSVDAVVQKADGTKIQNANVLIYENTVLADLVLETYSNSSGVAAGVFDYKKHSTNSATITYGGHAIRVDCWSYFPFIAVQISTVAFNGVVVLAPDTAIVAANQATALSDGSGITWNKDANASSVISYTGGSGTLSVGDTVTQATSGADGIVTKIISGDSIAGTVHLKTRDANAFSGTYGLSNGSGWTSTYTASSEKRYSIWIDGNSKTMQVTHDYLAALTSETTLSATGELIHEWGKENQARALYKGASGYYTSSSGTLGVFITNYGGGASGAVFQADDGTSTTLPTALSINITVQDEATSKIQNAQVAVYKTSNRTELMNGDTDINGLATADYIGSPVDIEIRVRKASTGATKYIPFSTLGSIGTINYNLLVTLKQDPNA